MCSIFLPTLIKNFKSYNPLLLQSTNKASVAVIIRVAQKKDTSQKEQNKAQVLFIKRADNPKDVWSGQLAFPGGRREKEESSYETAVRETKEEIGVDLNARHFVCIGRLNDRPQMKAHNLIVSSFVFLYTPKNANANGKGKENEIPLRLARNEINQALWIDVDDFLRIAVPRSLSVPIWRLPAISGNSPWKNFMKMVSKWLHLDFPCVYLARPPRYSSSLSTPSNPSLLWNWNENREKPRTPDDFVLWGMTMGIMVDAVALGGHELPSSLYIRGPFPTPKSKVLMTLHSIINCLPTI